MKRSIISAAVLSVVFMSAGVFAADTDQGELIITGKVVGTTCKFTGDSTATIGMNQIGTDRLNALTAGGVYDGYSNKTTVPLSVECTGNTAPKITFSSSQFDSANKYITRNTAANNGAGFSVYYGDDFTKPVNPEEGITLTKTADNKYTLNFSARYAKIGTAAVSAGDVASSLTMTVVTD
ncbi:fimbrial protein YehD [Citrobacter gillenii]|jgi:type 1 fimbria pilin|uniref:Fimbrial protein YehD n=1 Tax=Citrobacter gillenii TaxID=67828 RepID=A0ABD6LXM4_9ENTR|nr:fimbrial protein YehD [Citrobacter gillenii]NTZ49157.1 fimbrial protein YehD [Citrobacter gillenii]